MINLTTDQQVSLTVHPLSALGRTVPASTLTGIPLWNSSDVNVASLTVAADGLSATVIGVAEGTASINVIANSGTVATPVQIQGSVDISVNQAPAASLSLVSGSVVNQA